MLTWLVMMYNELGVKIFNAYCHVSGGGGKGLNDWVLTWQRKPPVFDFMISDFLKRCRPLWTVVVYLDHSNCKSGIQILLLTGLLKQFNKDRIFPCVYDTQKVVESVVNTSTF